MFRKTMFSKIMFRQITLLLIITCGGALSVNAAYEVNTLGANKAVPNSLIKSQVDVDTAGALLETPYKGFYQIGSKVINKRITFPKVKSKQSFPDGRWEALAKGIAGLAETPAFNTGSRIDPRATAYVAFYDVDIKGVDRSKVMLLPTSVEGEPNTLAVLLVRHKNHTSAKNAELGRSGQMGSNVYFFELAL